MTSDGSGHFFRKLLADLSALLPPIHAGDADKQPSQAKPRRYVTQSHLQVRTLDGSSVDDLKHLVKEAIRRTHAEYGDSQTAPAERPVREIELEVHADGDDLLVLADGIGRHEEPAAIEILADVLDLRVESAAAVFHGECLLPADGYSLVSYDWTNGIGRIHLQRSPAGHSGE